MENEKLVETVAKHGVEIAKLKEQNKNQDREIYELKDTTALMYKIATSVELLAKESIHTNSKLEKIDEKVTNVEKDLSEVKIKNNDLSKIKEDISGMKDDINKVKCKDDEDDAKKWRGTMKIVGTAVLGAVIGIVLSKIGLL